MQLYYLYKLHNIYFYYLLRMLRHMVHLYPLLFIIINNIYFCVLLNCILRYKRDYIFHIIFVKDWCLKYAVAFLKNIMYLHLFNKKNYLPESPKHFRHYLKHVVFIPFILSDNTKIQLRFHPFFIHLF